MKYIYTTLLLFIINIYQGDAQHVDTLKLISMCNWESQYCFSFSPLKEGNVFTYYINDINKKERMCYSTRFNKSNIFSFDTGGIFYLTEYEIRRKRNQKNDSLEITIDSLNFKGEWKLFSNDSLYFGYNRIEIRNKRDSLIRWGLYYKIVYFDKDCLLLRRSFKDNIHELDFILLVNPKLNSEKIDDFFILKYLYKYCEENNKSISFSFH